MAKIPDYLLPRVISNDTAIYSPIVLNYDWPAPARLVILLLFSMMGTVVNGFFVAAFFVESTLRKKAYLFTSCLGLADMLATTAIMPTSAIILMSGEWDILPVCHGLQILGTVSNYMYSLFFAFIGLENYTRICCSREIYKFFMDIGVVTISASIIIASFWLAIVGVVYKADYDYCERLYFGNENFRQITFFVLHVAPAIIAFFCLSSAALENVRRRQNRIRYKRVQLLLAETSTKADLTVFLLYILAWTPYIVIVGFYPEVSDSTYYNCIWIGLFRSVISNIVYCIVNDTIRDGFVQIFYYIFCMTPLAIYPRQRNTFQIHRSDVRVHLLHRALAALREQHATVIPRNVYDL